MGWPDRLLQDLGVPRLSAKRVLIEVLVQVKSTRFVRPAPTASHGIKVRVAAAQPPSVARYAAP